MDKATIEIVIGSEAQTCTVCVEPSDDLIAPVEASKAELIATMLCLQSRELMALSKQELMARQINKSFLSSVMSSVMIKPETTYRVDPEPAMRAMFICREQIKQSVDRTRSGIVWDYEETNEPYYHIYAAYGPLADVMDAIAIEIPLTDENDNDIQAIVDALRRIEARMRINTI